MAVFQVAHSVHDAYNQSSSSIESQTHMAKSRVPSHYPKYDDVSHARIVRFLVSCLMDQETHLDSICQMAGQEREIPRFRNQIQYHQHAIACIKWLVNRAGQRQRHLVEMTDEEFLNKVSECEQQ